MMQERLYDIAIVGGGAAGLTAAAECAKSGLRTLVIERGEHLGGVLLQCIHNGFGLHYFKEELTGPEYAARVRAMAEAAGADFLLETAVARIAPEGNDHILTTFSKVHGVLLIRARAVILAAGCRERCRGNLGIPGDRAAGVMNAGLAQQLLNLEGLLPGRTAVIVGSGDIGLIMARRLTWCGVKVEAVLEIMPHPSGLSRNIAQCLEDFDIPLHLSTGVTGIHGRKRVESITFAPLVNGEPDLAREERILCDTVLFSVGLVPENELARKCGVALNPLTGGALVDGDLMTGVPGIFSCGNVLHVHDLVDFVSQEAEACARNAVRYCRGERNGARQIPVEPGADVRYTVPNRCDPARETRFFLRARRVMERAELKIADEAGNVLLTKPLRYVKPAEMIAVALPAGAAKNAAKIAISLEEKTI